MLGKERFIAFLLGGTKKFTSPEDQRIIVNFQNNKINLPEEGIYDKIKEKSFIEQLGVYYQEELQGPSDTPNANKTKKKVITYIEVN